MGTTTTHTRASAPPHASGNPATPKTSSSSRPSSSTDHTSPAKTATSSTHHVTKTPSSITTSTTSHTKTPPSASSSIPTSTISTTSIAYSTTQSFPSSTANTIPSTTLSSTSTSTSTYTTTSSDLPTTQSPSVSGTGDYTYTSLFTSTDSNGVSHTITQIIAGPSGASRPGGFIHNAGAVAGVSILVGIVGAAAIAFGILYIRRRKKAQDEDFTAFSEMSYVAGGPPPDYGGSGSKQNNEYGLQPMNNDRHYRPPSSGSLYQPPLAPVDTLRDVPNPYPTLPQTQFSSDHPAALNMPAAEHQGYDTYTQNVPNQTPNHAGYNSHAEYHPDAGYNPNAGYNLYGGYNSGAVPTPDTGADEAMYDEDPFASHSQDGHSRLSSANLHENTSTAPPRRSASSRGNKSSKFGAEGKYYGEHGPTNNDSSGVLGRPITQSDHHFGEETMAPQAITSRRAIDVTRQSDATIKAHYDYYGGNL